MPTLAMLTTTGVALDALLAVPAMVVAVVLVFLLALFTTVAVVVGAGWALTRASAVVLGEGGEIWR